MSRRMSCSMTVDAVRDRTKTVTRRHVDTWQTLKPGDRLTLIEKGMGLPKGAKQVRLADVEIMSVDVEDVGHVYSREDDGDRECAAEGFPEMSSAEFIAFWLGAHGYERSADWSTPCRRIEWRYLDVVCPLCRNQFEGRMPGHHYGSNWDWVPCQTCGGQGFVAVDDAPVAAAMRGDQP